MAAEVIQRTAQLLRSRGERLTEPRVAVLEVLDDRTDHLTAEQLVGEVAGRHPGVHRASVYRALDALTALGVLTHVRVGQGAGAYHLAPPHLRAHLHAQCRACGLVLDLPADTLDAVAARVAAETGFQLHPGHVALSGLCADCARGS